MSSTENREVAPGGETRQARRIQARREHILKAAKDVFAEKGFRHATIRDVAIAADVADGTIYNYFENKDALLDALIGQLAVAEQAPLLDGPDQLDERVLKRMQALHDRYEDLMAVLPEILGTPELRRRYLEQFVQPVSEALARDLASQAGEGDQIRLETALAARILVSTVLGFQVLMILGDPLTESAWDNPEVLARVWARFLAAGPGLSR